MGRTPCCEKRAGMKKGPWTPEEDQKLLAYIEEHGQGSWRALPAKAGLQRCGKSCRLRWTNYLRPDIKRGKFSAQEEQTIVQLHALLGNRWSAIATHLPRRTDNEIKNYWNTHLKKRLAKMGIDPVTHKPIAATVASAGAGAGASLSHAAQWESARLEAEARLRSASSLPVTPASTAHRLDILRPWQRSHTWGDLESPTSTLSSQESLPFLSGVFADIHASAWFSKADDQQFARDEEEEDHWKFLNGSDVAAAGAAWFAAPLDVHVGGFTEMLLDGSDCTDITPAEAGEDYWDGILRPASPPRPATGSGSGAAPEESSSL